MSLKRGCRRVEGRMLEKHMERKTEHGKQTGLM